MHTGYLTATDGTLQMYLPKTNQIFVIYRGLPSDPKDPASPKPLPKPKSPTPKPTPKPKPRPIIPSHFPNTPRF